MIAGYRKKKTINRLNKCQFILDNSNALIFRCQNVIPPLQHRHNEVRLVRVCQQ